MGAHKSISNPGLRLPAPPRAHSRADGVGRRMRLPNQAQSHRARARLRKLAASMGLVVVVLLNTGASPTEGAIPGAWTTHFVDNGGPVLRTAQVYLLYWGSHWPATGAYVPTPHQITAAFQTLVAGPYLSGLAQYRDIRPAVLRGSTVVTTSRAHSGFDDADVSEFLNVQLDAGVVPGPDPANQTLYFVILPVGISAGGYRPKFDGGHDYYTRRGQRIHFAWAADSGSLDGATWIASHELVESITDPEGTAILGASPTCEQSGWCEIADVCTDTSTINGVAVSNYWSERARACVAPDLASTIRRGDEGP